MRKFVRLMCSTLLFGGALILPNALPAEAAISRPNCGDGSRSTCLHRQVAWEAAYALSSRADGTSSRTVNIGGTNMYESDWRNPSYPKSDQNALNQVAKRFPMSLWGDVSSAYHGGQCFFFAQDITYRASRGSLLLPTLTSALYSGGTSDRTKWREGDILQRDAGSSHTAVLWKINSRDSAGRVTSVEVIDSNWGYTELIHRHTLTVNSGTGLGNLGYSWHSYGNGKYN